MKELRTEDCKTWHYLPYNYGRQFLLFFYSSVYIVMSTALTSIRALVSSVLLKSPVYRPLCVVCGGLTLPVMCLWFGGEPEGKHGVNRSQSWQS